VIEKFTQPACCGRSFSFPRFRALVNAITLFVLVLRVSLLHCRLTQVAMTSQRFACFCLLLFRSSVLIFRGRINGASISVFFLYRPTRVVQ